MMILRSQHDLALRFLDYILFQSPHCPLCSRHFNHFSNRLIFVLPHGFCTCGYPFSGSLFLKSLHGDYVSSLMFQLKCHLLSGTVINFLVLHPSHPFHIPSRYCLWGFCLFVCFPSLLWSS